MLIFVFIKDVSLQNLAVSMNGKTHLLTQKGTLFVRILKFDYMLYISLFQ